MEVASKYSRYTVRCGLAVIAGVRLRTQHVELADNGDTQAQKAVTDAFIKHLRALGVFNASDKAEILITYEQLEIVKK